MRGRREVSPATHVITRSGAMLRIYSATCASASTSAAGCFARDGVLGTLGSNEGFVAMGEVSAGVVAGLVARADLYSRGGICADGCALQRVDVAARLPLSSRRHALVDAARVVAAGHDPVSDRFFVGYLLAGAGSNTFDGYRVELLAY